MRSFLCVLCVLCESAAETFVVSAPRDGDATVAIQRAIDEAWRQGGGRVELSGGHYAVRGLRVRSNVELHLGVAAVLDGSTDCYAFDTVNADPLEPISPSFRACLDHRGVEPDPTVRWTDGILRIFCATNVVISGERGSAIDGHNSFNEHGEEGYRGVHGIVADFATNVVVRGVEIRHAGNWATRFFDCADLRFEDLRIRGGHDGIHIRGADRVKILRCDIRTGDDAIAGFDNEDVEVADCALNTACNAFRFGGRHVRVTRCRAWGPAEWPFRGTMSLEDKRARRSSRGRGRDNMLNFWAYFAVPTRPVRHEAGDIVVSDCVVERANRFLHYDAAGDDPWQKGAPLADMRFERVKGTDIESRSIAFASDGAPVALAFESCEFSFRTPQKEFLKGKNLGAVNLKDTKVDGIPIHSDSISVDE